MRFATLGILLQDEQILLGEKKQGEIGTGKLSGPGGKIEDDETPEECFIRETREELVLEVDPDSLELVAYITFYSGRTRFRLLNRILNIVCMLGSKADFGVFVFRAYIPFCQLAETDDMIPNWYPLNNLPFERMYDGDRHWLLKAARGEKFCAKVYYRKRAKGFLKITFLPFFA